MGEVVDTAINVATLGTVKSDVSGKRANAAALDAQRNAMNQSNAASEQAWARQQEEMTPWKEAGNRALGRLQDGSFFERDAGYQFRLDEGNKGINSALAARGMANSGAALKELTRFGQNFASNEYQNAWNRENQLANYGNNASLALGNFAGGNAANLSNNYTGFGNATAAAEIGRSNRDAALVGAAFQGLGAAAGAAAGGGAGKTSSPLAASGNYTGNYQPYSPSMNPLSPQQGHNHWLNSKPKSMWG